MTRWSWTTCIASYCILKQVPANQRCFLQLILSGSECHLCSKGLRTLEINIVHAVCLLSISWLHKRHLAMFIFWFLTFCPVMVIKLCSCFPSFRLALPCRGFYVHGSVHRESMSVIVQRDATIYSLIIFLQTALHVSDDVLIHHQEHTQNCNYNIWHCLNRVCYRPLMWRSRNRVPTPPRQQTVANTVWTVPDVVITILSVLLMMDGIIWNM